MPSTLLQEEIQHLGPWFHNVHLPDGTETAPDHPLGDFPRYKWSELEPHLPDLRGWRALDIGCNAGFYSFEMARRGARVIAIDHNPRYLAQAGWARRQLNLEHAIELRRQDAYGLLDSHESFDLVLFLGIFYHLRYPLLVLDTLARITQKLLVFQTLTLPGEEGAEDGFLRDLSLDDRELMQDRDWPKLAFIERRLEDDPTNWWAPNPAAVRALLRSSGFRILTRPGKETYLCEPDPGNASSFWAWNEREYWNALRRRRNE